MTVEVIKAEPSVTKLVAVEQDTSHKVPDSKAVEKSSSYREESNFFSDLKDFEKKALTHFKSKLEDAILANTLFQTHNPPNKEIKGNKKKEDAAPAPAPAQEEEEVDNKEKEAKEEPPATAEEDKKEEPPTAVEAKPEGDDDKEKTIQELEAEKKEEATAEEVEAAAVVVVDRDISLWGVPLLPSKGEEGTDVVLLKFLRAREFKVNEAFEMLRKTLQWRKEYNIDSILEEDLGQDLDLAASFFTNGVDREGHPISYNVYGVFENEELYGKAFGDEEKRKHFLRWRIQQLEKDVQKLQFKPGCVTSLLQVSDLKSSPAPSKKDLRVATKQTVGILQDNYPELVARNIFINVPFWFYAFNALLSPFLTQRTRSKLVVARPAKVTETLLKYISVEDIPVKYGGFKRENDYEFGGDSEVAEVIVKAGSSESIEIPATEVGGTLMWDATVVGWEVRYKEEFVPADAGSYTIIIQKGKKVAAGEEPIRNTFRNNEPGKVVLTVDNCSSKKKRVLYRYKTKKTA